MNKMQTVLLIEKKSILILFLTLFSTLLIGQKVGINKINPSEELDVVGNINLTGEIKVDGAGGLNGQMLSSNGDGTMKWVGNSEYKFFKVFNSTTTWTVPAGVTEIMIEAWGAGAGGANGGGGGAGAYLTAKRFIPIGSTVMMTIGQGSEGNSSTSSNGGITTVQAGTGSATVYGGRGASTSNAGYPSTLPSATSSWFNVFALKGSPGFPATVDYTERSAGLFVAVTKGGNGADSYGFPNSGGKGATSVVSVTGGSLYDRVFPSDGSAPGAGGGGGTTAAIAEDGANGRVIIYWN